MRDENQSFCPICGGAENGEALEMCPGHPEGTYELKFQNDGEPYPPTPKRRKMVSEDDDATVGKPK